MRITICVEGETMGEVLAQLRDITPVLERTAAVDMAEAAGCSPPNQLKDLATASTSVLGGMKEDAEPKEPEAKDDLADLGKMKDEALALLQKAFTTNRAGVQAIQKRFGVKKFADVPVEKAAELLREAKAL